MTSCTGSGYVPRIDRNRCEGKAVCVEVCPYQVFELRALDADERAALGMLGRLKAWRTGGRQAFAVHAARCEACGLCVQECPEGAIRLEPWGA